MWFLWKVLALTTCIPGAFVVSSLFTNHTHIDRWISLLTKPSSAAQILSQPEPDSWGLANSWQLPTGSFKVLVWMGSSQFSLRFTCLLDRLNNLELTVFVLGVNIPMLETVTCNLFRAPNVCLHWQPIFAPLPTDEHTAPLYSGVTQAV